MAQAAAGMLRLDSAFSSHTILDDGGCGGDRRLEAEGTIEEEDVVIDRLGHADDRDLELGSLGGFEEHVGRRLCPVAADDKQEVDLHLLERLDALRSVKAAASRLGWQEKTSKPQAGATTREGESRISFEWVH